MIVAESSFSKIFGVGFDFSSFKSLIISFRCFFNCLYSFDLYQIRRVFGFET